MDQSENNNIYGNVKECVIFFENGTQKVFSSSRKKGELTVYVLNHRIRDSGFVKMVFKHYKGVNSLTEFAAQCGFNSTKTFTRHFKQKFNTTPKQWLLLIRKNEVVYYLENTDYPLKKIVSLLGFTNASHLRDFCIKKTGLIPERIREMKREEGA